jgi:protein tyrosine phosphatase (PTP) superfamily phosphohydrolase (DUF442 family)
MKAKIFGIILALSLALFGCSGGLHVNNHPYKGSGIYNFSKTDWGFRGSQPITPGDWDSLKKLGVVSIVNLRNDPLKGEKGEVESRGMAYYNIPMSDVTTPKVKDVKAALALIQNKNNQPVFLHCRVSHTRTALIAAVFDVVVKNMDKQKAWKQDAVDFGYFLFYHGRFEHWFLEGGFNPSDYAIIK